MFILFSMKKKFGTCSLWTDAFASEGLPSPAIALSLASCSTTGCLNTRHLDAFCSACRLEASGRPSLRHFRRRALLYDRWRHDLAIADGSPAWPTGTPSAARPTECEFLPAPASCSPSGSAWTEERTGRQSRSTGEQAMTGLRWPYTNSKGPAARRLRRLGIGVGYSAD
jgi:hypothetical protein